MIQKLAIRATVVIAALALGLNFANAQQAPTDIELKAAYCLAVTRKQVEGMEQAKVSDPEVKKNLSTTLRDAKVRLSKLQRYVTPRVQTLEPMPIVSEMNRGEADYTDYNQRMGEVAPACIISCQLLDSTGEARRKAMACLNRCVEQDELIARVNSCSRLTWLPS